MCLWLIISIESWKKKTNIKLESRQNWVHFNLEKNYHHYTSCVYIKINQSQKMPSKKLPKKKTTLKPKIIKKSTFLFSFRSTRNGFAVVRVGYTKRNQRFISGYSVRNEYFLNTCGTGLRKNRLQFYPDLKKIYTNYQRPNDACNVTEILYNTLHRLERISSYNPAWRTRPTVKSFTN